MAAGTSATSVNITVLLKAWGDGDEAALEQLIPLVYDHLRRLAGHYLRAERPDHTLQGTALVHEAYLRLVDGAAVDWKDRQHFFAVAARTMRRILVDAARTRQAGKRGGPTRVDARFDDGPAADPAEERASELLALDDALSSLARLDPRRAKVVELRYFGGLSVEETADLLRVSPQTVKRDWKLARAWLAREIPR